MESLMKKMVLDIKKEEPTGEIVSDFRFPHEMSINMLPRPNRC